MTMTRQAYRGFTLVEMLVVITIIGILVGLIMPALMSARDRARIASCSNNQRNVGAAVLMYENQKQIFPGFVEALGMGTRRTAASWQVVITPQMGRNDIWSAWQGGLSQSPAGNVNTYTISQMPDVAVFRCPSDSGRGQTLISSYVANCGRLDSPSVSGGVPSGSVPVDCSANGIFQNHFDGYILPTYQCKVSMSDIKDGAQQTILLSENLQAGQWTDPNPIPTVDSTATVLGVSNNPGAAALQRIEVCVGMVWLLPGSAASFTTVPPNSPARINSQKNDQFYVSNNITNFYYNKWSSGTAASTFANVARPSSNHPGGVVMTFCDGHTQFVRQDIEYLIYVELMTPDNSRCRDPGSSTVPTTTSGAWYEIHSATLGASDFNAL